MDFDVRRAMLEPFRRWMQVHFQILIMSLDYQVGIIGAGFGGLIAALELKRAGHSSFAIFERSNEVGGVWRDNIYPGCACDVRSNLYSIATQPNPEWSSKFSSQPEILRYLKQVMCRNDLETHIRFNSLITEIKFLDQEGCWQLVDQNRVVSRVKLIIVATGPQNRPYVPVFKGQETFKGKVFHSSAWDSSIDLAGKSVAVVGTGASAIQIVPNIAPVVSKLVLFQRTAAWIVPRLDRSITSIERWLFRRLSFSQMLTRQFIYWLMEFAGLAFLGNATLHNWLTRIALKKLDQEVLDPETRKKLTPDYKIGCKRILLSDDFYPACNRPNVHVVTDDISAITPHGIQTADGRIHEVDHIILATGFVVAGTENYLRVVGSEGRVLTDDWDLHGPQAYLGINVAGYPNMALLLGPNSGLGHSSAIHVLESQMRYVLQYIAALYRAGARGYLDVKTEVQKLYNAELQTRFASTIWASGCRSWYLNRNGRNATLYPGLTWQYRRATARFNLSDYLVAARP